MLLLLSCVSVNSEPRFISVNGQSVKRIFGIPFLPDALSVRPGETLEIEIEVLDRERDDIELLFPHVPAGFDFPRDGKKGTYSPPSEQTFEQIELEIIALDEHGASEVMYLLLEVPGATWSFGDTGAPSFDGPVLFGEVDTSAGFDGYVGLYVEDDITSCIWAWESTTLTGTPTDCAECDQAWAFTASGGLQYEGDCSTVESATTELPEQQIGFAAEYDYEGFPLTDVVFTPIEGEWLPLGQGTLEDSGRFEFYVPLPEP